MAAKRVVLVTGASSGIGLETARLLNQDRELRVFGTHLPGDQGSDPGCEMLELKTTCERSVNRCVGEVLDRAGRLDVLINNAGIGLVGMVEETSLDECRVVFETNYFGTVRMIRAVLPTMREQGKGLIVNISSVAGHIGVPYEAHYCASKLALDCLTRALRYEVAAFGISVCVVAPGYVRTPFYDSLAQAKRKLAEYARVRDRALQAFEGAARNSSEAQTIARAIVRILRSRSPRLRYWVGRDACLYAAVDRLIPAPLLDWIMRLTWVPTIGWPNANTASGPQQGPLLLPPAALEPGMSGGSE